MPHRDEDALIQCQFFDYPLLDSSKGTHLYEALSYVWGSPDKPRRVSTDQGCLNVTENLHAALLRLRDRSLQRIIWVDAICINQDDKEEQSHQVQSMAKIYARASRVIVWLEDTVDDGQVDSDAAADSRRALEEIGRAADGRDTKSSDSTTNSQAVLKLLQRSWFRRVWVSHSTNKTSVEVINQVVLDASGGCCCSACPNHVSCRGDRWIRLLLGIGQTKLDP